MGQQQSGWQGDQNQNPNQPQGYPPPGQYQPQGYPPPGQYQQQGYPPPGQHEGYPPQGHNPQPQPQYQPPSHLGYEQPQQPGWQLGPNDWVSSEAPDLPKSKKKLWLWLAPVLALVVAAAVVVPIVLTSDDSSSPAPAGGQPAPAAGSKNWQVHLERPQYEKGFGSWEVGDTLVVAYQGLITAFAKADGKQVWQAKPPAEGGKFCGVGTRPVNDQMAIAFGKDLNSQGDANCKFAALLNLKTGQLGWQQPMEVPQSVNPEKARTGAALEIMGGVVVVAQNYGTIGLDLATGSQRWSKPVVKPTGGDQGSSTIVSMLPAKDKLIVSIAGFISDPALTFAYLDPATGELSQGKDYGTKDGDGRFGSPRLLTADPPVALVNGDKNAVYLVMDEKFEKTGLIDAGKLGEPDGLHSDGVGLEFTNNHQQGHRFLMSGGLFVSVTSIPLNGTNKLVAYDVASGAKKWEQAIPDGKAIMPLAVENGSVVVLLSPATPQGDQRIARFTLADGSPGPVATYPLKTQSGGAPITQDFQFYWHDERLWAVRGPSNPFDYDAFSIGK
ncbi:PQQ-like domain-containing protein [Amycolatopsis xylanica]|uniref:PQQ-like domain-containing protein n=1 Tax=Amycolatopsis xylanica TaxID=589385 RepID=A0A1H3RNZ2_9PSEU|nr:PQQ-binding-like beta-propeller repeat protein [Amycolatopsis xylanica]SDZ27442.1 PQQ-like domain-containing protein [Amycolatopsis xylanica]